MNDSLYLGHLSHDEACKELAHKTETETKTITKIFVPCLSKKCVDCLLRYKNLDSLSCKEQEISNLETHEYLSRTKILTYYVDGIYITKQELLDETDS